MLALDLVVKPTSGSGFDQTKTPSGLLDRSPPPPEPVTRGTNLYVSGLPPAALARKICGRESCPGEHFDTWMSYGGKYRNIWRKRTVFIKTTSTTGFSAL